MLYGYITPFNENSVDLNWARSLSVNLYQDGTVHPVDILAAGKSPQSISDDKSCFTASMRSSTLLVTR